MSFVSRVVRRVVSAYGPRMRRAVFGLAVVSLVVACSGDGSSDGPSSGGSSSSGASGGQSGGTGAGGSGGDPSSGGGGPQGIGGSTGGNTTGGGELRGAASLHVLSPAGCSLAEHFEDFPELSSGRRPVTEAAKVQGVVDGGTTSAGEPASVVCTWRPANGVVLVDGVIRLGPAGSQRFVNLGGVMVSGETYESGIALSGPALPHQYDGRGSCSYTAFEVDDETRSVWGTLSCEELTSLDDTDTCALGPSYFFFENCDLAD